MKPTGGKHAPMRLWTGSVSLIVSLIVLYVFIVPGAWTGAGCSPKSRPARDDFSLTIKKTPCYGTCPTYELRVGADGAVVYNAIRFTEQTGVFTKKIPAARLDELKKVVRESPFFSWDTLYDDPGITDLPSTIVEISLDGRRKKVVNRHKGPQEFKVFVARLEEIVGKDGYVKKEE
jgi:hypothetical protein